MKRWIVIGAAVAAAGIGVLIWFQPQKLFVDTHVSESAPTVAPATAAPMRALSGEFTSIEHHTVGTARIIETGMKRVLRLEGFSTSNGPDVRVILSASRGGSYGRDFVDLGPLKGNIGDQNYSIPANLDLDKYGSAVIWCRRFTVAFGAATLS